MNNLFTIKRICLLALLAFLGNGLAFGNNTYYSRLTGTANPTGAGTVYIDGQVGSNTRSSDNQQNHNYSIKAEASDGYTFISWNGSGASVANISEASTTATIYPTSTNNNNPTTGTVTATFARVYTYYAIVNTTISPSNGGSVTGDTSTKSGSSTSSSADITFILTATPNSDYAFLGWSTSANEGDIINTSATQSFTVTATSTTENSPTALFTYALFALQVETPIITIDLSTGNTTITCSTEGATIYYTTNGDTPTTSSLSSSSPVTFTVSEGTTVKAMASKSGYRNSNIASQTYSKTNPTGISGGVVTLNDYEDHTWTYYAGVDTSVDGGNYNTNYVGKMYSPNPRNVKITYSANGGAVSIDEDETKFVYYKTLEQGATAGQYPYTVISNPFSKRPNGKGFGGWRIKEGAQYINGYNDEAILPLDAEIVFVNLPYGRSGRCGPIDRDGTIR